jgi:Raf kinase inhibitor-like YbhB/YbcL family protein
MKRLVILLTSLVLATTALAQHGGNMKIESSAFANGQPIPQKFTCQGADISPALTWSGAPDNTKSFALIVDDPDAPVGTWVHWVFFNLPTGTQSLPENVSTSEHTQNGVQGINDFKKIGYGGPCPPPGKPHRYFFKLYALDTTVALIPGATKQDVEKAMQGHVLAHTELMGTYQRR